MGSNAASQARLEEARKNWDAALASKDRALQQLEESLHAERQSCQQHRSAAGEGSAVSTPATT